MKKGRAIFLGVICLVAGMQLAAQSDSMFISPYNPKGNYNTWGIKGKILPFLFGNSMGGNYFLGFEYGFCKNHSIGIDFSFYGTEGDRDPDTNGVILSYYSTDKTVYLNYRYYLGFPKLRDKGVCIYLGTLLRYGKKWESSDPGYSSDGFLFSRSAYKCAGAFAGTLIRFKEQKRLALDINIRYFFRQEFYTDIHYQSGAYQHLTTVYNTWNIGLGLNLYLCYYRYKELGP